MTAWAPTKPADGLLTPGRARSTTTLLSPSWALTAMLVLYPLWWVLGLQMFMWGIIPNIALIGIVMRGRVVAPPGFWIWACFIVWMIMSATQVDTTIRLAVWALRALWYLGLTSWMLLLLDRHRIPRTESIARSYVWFWSFAIVGGFAGLLWPYFQFRTPMAQILPDFLLEDAFVRSMVIPGLADIAEAAGGTPRPRAPFGFTNGWGAAVGLLTPIVIGTLISGRKIVNKKVVQLGLILSVIPGVLSLNRGLWMSLTVGLIYAAARLFAKGQVRALLAVCTLAIGVIFALYTTPLGDIATSRIENAHSNEGRASLYRETIDKVAESPFIGYGGPRPQEGFEAGPHLGTHGHIWLTLMSQGFVGAGLFFAFFVGLMWHTRSPDTELGFWCHVVLFVLLIQSFIYGLLPVELFIATGAAAIALRESTRDGARSARERWRPRSVGKIGDTPHGELVMNAGLGGSATPRSGSIFGSATLDRLSRRGPAASIGNSQPTFSSSVASSPQPATLPLESRPIAKPPSPAPTNPRLENLSPIDSTDALEWASSILFAPESLRRLVRSSTPVEPHEQIVGSFLVENEAGPELLLPTGRKATVAALRRFHDGMDRPRRRKKMAAVALAKSGALAKLWRGRVNVVTSASLALDGQASLLAHLNEVVGQPCLHAMTFGPPLRLNRKPVIQMINPQGDVVGFAKIGWNQRTKELLNNEIAWLRKLEVSVPKSFAYPAVLNAGSWRGVDYALFDPVPSTYRSEVEPSSLVGNDVFAEIAELSGTEVTPLIQSAFVDRIERYLRRHPNFNLIARYLEQHRDMPLTFGSWHGDVSPWNVSTIGGLPHIIDWEYAASPVPVAFDMFNAIFQVEVMLKRKNPEEVTTQIVGRASEMAEGTFGLSPDEISVSFGCFLIEVIAKHKFLGAPEVGPLHAFADIATRELDGRTKPHPN